MPSAARPVAQDGGAAAAKAADRDPHPVSVIVGAGPAGLVAAAYLARAGHTVHVYDRRPCPHSVDSAGQHRAFVVLCNTRGQRALAGAGLGDLSAAAASEGLQEVGTLVRGTGAGAVLVRATFQQPRWVGSRHAFVCTLLREVQRLYGDALTFHWSTSFEGCDLTAKTATFAAVPAASAEGSGSTNGSTAAGAAAAQVQRYDLLIGADGGSSRVRRAAEKQVPALRAWQKEVPRFYKVFRGLPPSPALPIRDADGRAQLHVLMAPGGGGFPRSFLFLSSDPASGTAHGTVASDAVKWGSFEGAGQPEFQAFLADQFPVLPEEWRPKIAAQLAANPLCSGILRVRCTQLHGPSLLLLGDAGHAVSPSTGNGMNSALEDAWLLGQLLEGGADLSTLPERFTAARLDDMHALVWLDEKVEAQRGVHPTLGRLHPAYIAQAISMPLRLLLSRATGGRVLPPAVVCMNETCVPFASIQRMVQRDSALLAAAAVAGVAAAAAALMRRR